MALDTVNALVTLAEAKAFLKITGASEDSVIESMINRASSWANDYTQRLLLLRLIYERYNGDGTDTLFLRNYPVALITEVRINDGSSGGGAPYPLSNLDYTYDDSIGIVKFLNGIVAFPGFQNISVTYAAGYSLADLPESIQEAVLIYIGYSYRRQYADQKFGVVSETTGDRTTSYSNEDFPARAKSLLNPYRSERVFLGV